MSSPSLSPVQNPLLKTSAIETVQVLRDVQGPMIAKGPIIRRPKVVAVSERFDLDGRAVRRVQTLTEKYGRGPLMLNIPGRNMAKILDPDDVHRVLEGSPSRSRRPRRSSATRSSTSSRRSRSSRTAPNGHSVAA